MLHKDGSKRWIAFDGRIGYELNGNFKQTHCILQDFTDRQQTEAALRESESKYRLLIENLNEGIWYIDENAHTTFVNQRMAEMLGYTVEEMSGKHLFEFMDEQGKAIAINKLESRQQGMRDQHEFEFIRKDGSRIYTLMETGPITDVDGRYAGAVAGVIDITGRRKLEHDYQTLFTSMLDGFAMHEIICDEAGKPCDYRFLDINPAFERMTGLGRDIVGKTVLEVLPGTERYWIEAYGRVALTGEPDHFENVAAVIGKWFEVTAFSNAPGQFACTFIDITERKRAEEALRESEERFREVTENIREAFWLGSLDWTQIYYISPAYSIIWGRPKEELLSHPMSWFNSVVEEDKDIILASITGRNPQDEVITFPDYRIRKPDGTVIWISAHAFVVKDANGQPYRIAGVAEDITERKRAEEALRKSEAYLANAANMAQIGYWELDIETGIFTFSDSFYALLHTTADEMGGYQMTIADYATRFVHPEDTPLVELETLKAIETDDPEFSRYLEHRIFFADGSEGYIAVKFFITKDNSGKTIRTFGVNQDITTRKKMELELQKFFLIAESSSEFIGMCDLNMQPVYVNPAGQKIVGLPDMAAACRVRVQDYFFPEDQQFIAEEFFPRVLKEGHGDIEIRLRNFKTGEAIWYNYYLFAVNDAHGNRIGWATVSRDITERRLAENQLKLLNRAVEATSVSIVITDSKGEIIYVNPFFTSLTGYIPEEARGQNPRILKSGIHPVEFYSDLWKQILSGKDWTGELCNKKKNGELYWVKAVISPILDKEGRISNFVSIKEDITERKMMEEDLLHAKEKAEESDRLKSAFLANMSHEIRTPMNGILGFLELLGEPDLNNTEKEKYTGIVKKKRTKAFEHHQRHH